MYEEVVHESEAILISCSMPLEGGVWKGLVPPQPICISYGHVSDQFVEASCLPKVNQESLEDITHEEAVAILKATKDTVSIGVARAGVPASEAPMPLPVIQEPVQQGGLLLSLSLFVSVLVQVPSCNVLPALYDPSQKYVGQHGLFS